MTKLRANRATALLGCTMPVVLAGMGGVARSELVAAVSAAGGFGFLGMVREPVDLIEREVAAVRRLGQQRFGVNLIPAATPAELLAQQVEACIALKVPVVCLFWDLDAALVKRLREAGIVVVYQVGSVAEGVAAAKAGTQVLIAQGVEAGGHVRGTVPLHDLLSELVAAVDVPVLAAGGLSDGEDLVLALGLGAEGIVLGTAMIATRESFAHDFHKERLLTSNGGDTLLTSAFHVNWPADAAVRVLKSEVTKGWRGDPFGPGRKVIGWEDGRPIYLFSTDSPLRSMTGDFGAMALYAGMGVGRVRKMQGAREKLDAIVQEAEALLQAPAGTNLQVNNSAVCYAGEMAGDYMGDMSATEIGSNLAALNAELRVALRLVLGDAAASPRHDFRSLAPAGLQLARWVPILDELGGDTPPATSPVPADKLPLVQAAILSRLGAMVPRLGETPLREALAGLLATVEADRLRGLTALSSA